MPSSPKHGPETPGRDAHKLATSMASRQNCHVPWFGDWPTPPKAAAGGGDMFEGLSRAAMAARFAERLAQLEADKAEAVKALRAELAADRGVVAAAARRNPHALLYAQVPRQARRVARDPRRAWN